MCSWPIAAFLLSLFRPSCAIDSHNALNVPCFCVKYCLAHCAASCCSPCRRPPVCRPPCACRRTDCCIWCLASCTLAVVGVYLLLVYVALNRYVRLLNLRYALSLSVLKSAASRSVWCSSLWVLLISHKWVGPPSLLVEGVLSTRPTGLAYTSW